MRHLVFTTEAAPGHQIMKITGGDAEIRFRCENTWYTWRFLSGDDVALTGGKEYRLILRKGQDHEKIEFTRT